jgi:hypothetical protein
MVRTRARGVVAAMIPSRLCCPGFPGEGPVSRPD